MSDDEADSDHFPLPQIDMLREVSAIADRYDVTWDLVSRPESDYGDEATVRRALADWRECSPPCRGSRRFIPGGIPDRRRRLAAGAGGAAEGVAP